MAISVIFDKMKMNRLLYFFTFCFLLTGFVSLGQVRTDSTLTRRVDSVKPRQRSSADTTKKKTTIIVKRPLQKKQALAGDSAFSNKPIDSQQPVTLPIPNLLSETATVKNYTLVNNTNSDSTKVISQLPNNNFTNITNRILSANRFINIKDSPVFFIETTRSDNGKEFLFYSIFAMVLILGIFKTFYRNYFNNLFRVFFNTSLRQSQLADQLLQAKLPSFILNIFFTISLGVYVWLLLKNFHPVSIVSSEMLLPFCIAAMAVLYFLKFCLLKFMGWLSDIRETTNNYIFVIFLVNKITGIILVPFIILLAFAQPSWTQTVARVSVLVLGLFFLSRYVKSYGIIQKKISVHPFHFLIYILGAEIIPLFIFYKLTMDYLI